MNITVLSKSIAAMALMVSVAQADEYPIRNAYFSETNIHTKYSPDAYIVAIHGLPVCQRRSV